MNLFRVALIPSWCKNNCTVAPKEGGGNPVDEHTYLNMYSAFHFLEFVSEHVSDGWQVWQKHGFGWICECNGGQTETEHGTRKLHLISNGSVHLLIKHWGHQTLVEPSGWMGCSAKIGVSSWILSFLLISHNTRLRTASRLGLDSYGALTFSRLCLEATVSFVWNEYLFLILYPFHSYVVLPLWRRVGETLCASPWVTGYGALAFSRRRLAATVSFGLGKYLFHVLLPSHS